MSKFFIHQNENQPRYYLTEGEIYMLEYTNFNSEQIGFDDGSLSCRELYSSLEAAEKRIIYLLKNRRNFSGFDVKRGCDIHYEDWGITYIATKKSRPDAYAKFVIQFVKVYDRPLEF